MMPIMVSQGILGGLNRNILFTAAVNRQMCVVARVCRPLLTGRTVVWPTTTAAAAAAATQTPAAVFFFSCCCC